MSASTCCDGVGDGVVGLSAGGCACAGVAGAGAAGSAGVAGVAAGSLGAGVVPEVPVGDGVAVAADGVGLALAAALGSSLRGVEADPPLIAAANAVTCVRTS